MRLLSCSREHCEAMWPCAVAGELSMVGGGDFWYVAVLML